jgi:hypothetical protein
MRDHWHTIDHWAYARPDENPTPEEAAQLAQLREDLHACKKVATQANADLHSVERAIDQWHTNQQNKDRCHAEVLDRYWSDRTHRCERKRIEGSDYCWQHQPGYKPKTKPTKWSSWFQVGLLERSTRD